MLTITMEQALDASGMRNIRRVYASYYFEYNGHQIEMHQTEGGYDWQTYTFNIDGKKIATRANYRTMMRKIKTYKGDK